MIDEIACCTNRYAQHWIDKNESDGGWYTERWREVDRVELLAFFGCLFFTGLSSSRHENVEQLWSSDLGRAALLATMSLSRFQSIMKFLRFDDVRTRG